MCCLLFVVRRVLVVGGLSGVVFLFDDWCLFGVVCFVCCVFLLMCVVCCVYVVVYLMLRVV